jgi:hypothetical protein
MESTSVGLSVSMRENFASGAKVSSLWENISEIRNESLRTDVSLASRLRLCSHYVHDPIADGMMGDYNSWANVLGLAHR